MRINGRLYDKHGVDCATTAVALYYKVYDPSFKHYKFAILVGIARQHPNDSTITEEIGEEIATENAMIDPVMVIEYPHKVHDDIIYNLLESYVGGLPIQFVKTRSEIKAEGKDVTLYNRGTIKDEYYKDYYKEIKKIY